MCPALALTSHAPRHRLPRSALPYVHDAPPSLRPGSTSSFGSASGSTLAVDTDDGDDARQGAPVPDETVWTQSIITYWPGQAARRA